MPRNRHAEDDEDEETGSNASDPSEPPPTWPERFDWGVELCARHAPGWIAASIILLWLSEGVAHWYGWYDWVEASWFGNYEYTSHR